MSTRDASNTTRNGRLVLPALALAPVLVLAVALAPVLGGCARGARRLDVAPADAVRISDAHAVAYEASRMTDPAKSARRYADALTRYDDFPAAWNNLGVALMAKGEYLDAETAFARAAEQSRTDPRPLYNRGLLWMRRHYPADARRYFRQALERDAYYLPALRGAVECDIMLRETTAETLDNIRRALMLERDPRWLERLETQRVKVQAGLAMPESPRSLDEMDLGPARADLPRDGAPAEPADERQRRLIEEAIKSRQPDR